MRRILALDVRFPVRYNVVKEHKMITISATEARKDFYGLLKKADMEEQPVFITHKNGKGAVLVSAEAWGDVMETLYLESIPGMREKIIDGLKTPEKECIPEEEVNWDV